jgi:excisionase family DNA binding protein
MLSSTDHEAGTAVAPGDDELLTAEEVAELLRMSPAWVYAETRGRRIPHIRLGRRVCYRRSALDAWIDELECQTRTAASTINTAGIRRRR